MAALKVFRNGELVKTLELDPGQEYIFGRGADCAFSLTSGTRISRHHFKLVFNGATWQLELLSKFGGIQCLGAEVEGLELQDGQSFSIQSYEFIFAGAAAKPEAEKPAPPMNALAPVHPPYPALNAEPDYQAQQMERTFVGTFEGMPYLRISLPDGQQEILRLEGNLWTAGRDASCEIVIKDRGASRRHFELSLAGGQAYVVDLNSANGTMINGKKIIPDQATPIKSGDVISVLSVSILFELRDPNFEKQLQLIPSPVLEPVKSYPVYHPGGPAHYAEAPPAPANALVTKPSLKNLKNWENWEVPVKGRNIRVGDHKKKIFATVVVSLLLFVVMTPTPKKGGGQRVPANVHETFANMTPEKKTFIRDTYKLAKNLYLQRNYPLALKELNEIHELIPFYEDSRQLESECKQYIDIKAQQEYIARQKAAAEELERRISAKIFECESKMTAKTTMEDLNGCLGQAIDLNPDHEGIRRLQSVIEEREAEAQRQAALREEFRRRTLKGNALYEKAKDLETAGKDYHAILAYKRYLNSGLPDTSGYRTRANRSMASLEKNLKFKVESMIKRAQSYFDQTNYREAMKILKSTEKIDPKSRLIDETKEKFRKQINRQMKTIYEDSVLEESLGNVEAAKDKWRKILEMSYPEDSYYQKAKAKLKKYGG